MHKMVVTMTMRAYCQRCFQVSKLI